MKVFDFRLRPPFGDFKKSFFYSEEGLRRFHEQNGMEISRAAAECSMELFLQEMDENGIVMGMAHANLDLNVSNQTIADLVTAYPDRFTGCIDVDLYNMQAALDDMDRYVVNGPCRCVNLEPAWLQNSPPLAFNDRRIYPIFEKCQKHGIIVNYPMGVGADRLSRISPHVLDEVAREFPEMTIVVSHGGWPFVTECCWIAKLRKNVWLSPDHYMFNMPGAGEFVTAINHLLSDKMLYATCYPFVSMKSGLEYTLHLDINENSLEKYLYGNAMRLFGLE